MSANPEQVRGLGGRRPVSSLILHPYLMLRDVDEQLLLQKLLQDVLGGHVDQGLEETPTLRHS